jgi:hypothetical protein
MRLGKGEAERGYLIFAVLSLFAVFFASNFASNLTLFHVQMDLNRSFSGNTFQLLEA